MLTLFKPQKKKRKSLPEKSPVLEALLQQIASANFPTALQDPIAIAKEQKRLAIQYENFPPYFDCTRFECPYLRPFIKISADFIIANVPNQDAVILDLCGGMGNQGLYLSFAGYTEYILADIDEIRMAWGALLWKKCGKTLNWQFQNALQMTLPDHCVDVVSLMGWEAPVLPYSYTFKECLRVMKPGAFLIFTYHDMDGIIEGNWDFDPERNYSYLPYSISRPALQLLCEGMGLEIIDDVHSGYPEEVRPFFPDERPRAFPQRVAFCKKL